MIALSVCIESFATPLHANDKPVDAAQVPPELGWYQKAQILLEKGEYKTVVSSLKSKRFARLEEAKRKFILARAYAKLGQFSQAATLAEESFQMHGSLYFAKFNQACYQTLNREFAEAFSTIDQLQDIMIGAPLDSRESVGRAMQNDADLELLRTHPKYKSAFLDISKSLLEQKGKSFKGCALKDNTGKITKVKHFDCMDFDGATFSGSAQSCEKGWVKINEVISDKLFATLGDVCIYEL